MQKKLLVYSELRSFSYRLLETLASDPEIADDLKVVNKMIDDFNLQVDNQSIIIDQFANHIEGRLGKVQ